MNIIINISKHSADIKRGNHEESGSQQRVTGNLC